MKNFYELISTMKNGEVIKSKNTHNFRIRKDFGTLEYIDAEGNVDKSLGADGLVTQLDNMNLSTWEKEVEEEFVQVTDWNEIQRMFTSGDVVYVDGDKEEASRWTPVEEFSINDFDDLFRLTKFFKKVVR